MKGIKRLAQLYTAALVLLWILPIACFATIRPDEIGVRQSNFSGVAEKDLDPGWALRIPGVHKIIPIPRKYQYLDYSASALAQHQSQLQIRTKDNNIVFIDVAVPYRVRPGEGWQLVRAGNHQQDADGRFRFQRLAGDTTVSVLRERLAELSSAEFYSTDRRLEVAESTLVILNDKLAELHLEAERILIRAVQFRPEYERQLQQIQLNEQKKLLDEATETVARKQQTLDNFQQGTNALAASLEQRWIAQRADLERAYQVGFVQGGEDVEPGAARRVLEAMSEEDKAALFEQAAQTLGIEDEKAQEALDEPYLLGIQNIQAETLEYEQRVRTEADGLAARLAAEGEAEVARVRGDFEGRVNQLLDSAAGRAYVAWKTADHVKFDETLVFNSADGVPSVLQLRRLTELFMGR